MAQHYTYTPLTKSRQRPKISSRQYLSDYESRSLYNNKLRKRQISGEKLKLVQVSNPLRDSASRLRRRVYSYYQKQPSDEQLNSIKKDVSKLEYEIMKRRSRLKGKMAEILPNSRLRIRTLPQQLEMPSRNTYQVRRWPSYQRQKSLWLQSQNLNTPMKKKLYKIKNKRKKFLLDTNYDEDQDRSIIALKYSRTRQSPYFEDYYERPVLYKVRHPPKIARFLRYSRNVQRFRKIANVVLFTIRLRTFNERMRIRRFDAFKSYVHGDLNKKLLQLKNEFILCSKNFFATLIDQQNFDYRLHETDEVILKREKINSVCKLVNLQVRYIQKCIKEVTSRQTFAQLVYYLCKHGNYTCAWQLNTAEQFNLLCISQSYGYVSADKYLQQSAIISLVFIKILLFNIFLQPQRIDIAVNQNINLKVIFANVKLVGNILYELFLDIQDEMLNKAPHIYTVGNWTTLKNTFKFKVAESMTVKQGFVQKNELISGLASNKYIRDIYGTRSMLNQRQILKTAVKQLHQNMVDHHVKVRHLNFVR